MREKSEFLTLANILIRPCLSLYYQTGKTMIHNVSNMEKLAGKCT